MLSSAVSFAPTMLEESGIILNAMQARGLELKGGICRKIKAMKYILVPLVVNVLRAGRKLAIAADARGFRANRHRTYVNELKLKRNDYVFWHIQFFYGNGPLSQLRGFWRDSPGLTEKKFPKNRSLAI